MRFRGFSLGHRLPWGFYGRGYWGSVLRSQNRRQNKFNWSADDVQTEREQALQFRYGLYGCGFLCLATVGVITILAVLSR